MSLRYKEAEAM